MINWMNDNTCSQFLNHIVVVNVGTFGSSPDCVPSSINKTHRPGEVFLFLLSFSHLLTISALKRSAAAFSCRLSDEKQLFTYTIDGSQRDLQSSRLSTQGRFQTDQLSVL